MMVESGERSRSHGLPRAVIQAQADALGIQSIVCPTSWDNYEKDFISVLHEFKKQGITYGVFGDIDLEPHLEWVERVCSSVGIKAYEPLWQTPRHDLLDEFLKLGFKATIVNIKQEALDNSFLGFTLDRDVIANFEKAGIDISGEQGEYHTIVTDGPIFSRPINIQTNGQVVHDGYCFQNVSLKIPE